MYSSNFSVKTTLIIKCYEIERNFTWAREKLICLSLEDDLLEIGATVKSIILTRIFHWMDLCRIFSRIHHQNPFWTYKQFVVRTQFCFHVRAQFVMYVQTSCLYMQKTFRQQRYEKEVVRTKPFFARITKLLYVQTFVVHSNMFCLQNFSLNSPPIICQMFAKFPTQFFTKSSIQISLEFCIWNSHFFMVDWGKNGIDLGFEKTGTAKIRFSPRHLENLGSHNWTNW